MANKKDKAVEIFSDVLKNKKVETNEIEGARKAIRELAKHPTPANRYEIAQLMAFIIDDYMSEKVNYLEMIGDTKTVSIGEKAMFKIKKSGIQAYIQAKNGTTQRSRIYNAYTDIETVEVSSRPYVNLYELAAGKANFDDYLEAAANEMEKKMVQNIETTLYAAFSGYNYPFYATGSGFVSGTFDPMLRAIQRFGKVTLFGDISLITKIAESTGFTTTTSTKQYADQYIVEQNNNGFIGTYKSANVVQMDNPFENGTVSGTSGSEVTGTVLRMDLLYLIPAGKNSPLKIVKEGTVEAMDEVNIDDNTMDVCLRSYFGSAVIYGDNPFYAVYEDSSL